MHEREGKSVGVVIRDAVDGFIFAEPDRRRRAVKSMFEMNAPVEDWEVMKAQIQMSQLATGDRVHRYGRGDIRERGGTPASRGMQDDHDPGRRR